jgi:ABC-2 type transport system ATP-binding protein
MSENSAVSFHQVVKRRGELTVGPLNLEIPKGYVTAIVGMNGSGKSTLMNLLLGILHPDQGEIRIEGMRYDPANDEGWKQQLGYVPELPSTEDDFETAEQLAKIASYWYSSWNWQLYRKLAAKYEVPPTTKLKKMSKGMRRKLEIALALAHQPKVLLLDEPSSGLDPIAWRSMIEDVQEVLQDGEHTAIIATHVIEEVRRLADYILFIHQGQVMSMVEKDQLFDSWKEYWINGVMAEDLVGAPGLADTIQERSLVRVIAHDARKLEPFLEDEGLEVVKTQALPLDEVMIYMIKMSEERSVRAR